MKQLLTISLLLSFIGVCGQNINSSSQVKLYNADDAFTMRGLIADETYFLPGDKKKTIICSNDTLNARLLRAFETKLLRYSVVYKNDRAGRYKEITYSLPLDVTDKDIIETLK